MNKELVELIAGVLDVAAEDLTAESGPLSVPQWDSLGHVTIVAAIEDTFRIELSMPQILGAKSIADFQKLIEENRVG